MADRRDALSDLRTAFNCPAKWSEMKGDDRVRHCSRCKLNVYNITAMSRDEAVNLLEANGEKMCVRYYQKADGTILTSPCGRVAKAAFRWKLAFVSALSALGLMACMPVYAGARMSPGSMFKSRLRMVQTWNQMISEEKDPATRADLMKERDKAKAEMMNAYRALSTEDMDKMAPLLREKA